MTRIDRPGAGELSDVKKRVRRLELATPLGHASIGSGGLRVHSGGVITIQNGGLSITGTAEVIGQLIGNGTLTWTGTANFDGPLIIDGATTINGNTSMTGTTTVTGTLNVDGPLHVDGATDFNGTLDIGGATEISGTLAVKGAATLESNLTLTGAGAKITAGVVSLDSGGTLRSTNALLIVAVGLTTVQNDFTVVGNFTVQGAKAFKIPHPSRPGYSLMHGSTESPVSGTEYWGTGTFDASGALVVILPSYFEALNKPTGRAVIVSPIGRPFAIGADEIASGKFTAYGTPGRKFTWLVKAERIGADFETESVAIEPDHPLYSVQ